MSRYVEEVLRSKNIHPTDPELESLAAKWQALQRQRGTLASIALDDADIALRCIPGGDHVEQ